VVFAEVVGSTELIQGRDPEEARRLLDGLIQVHARSWAADALPSLVTGSAFPPATFANRAHEGISA